MGWSGFAHPSSRRLGEKWTDADLRAMAVNPSYRAPHPDELLNPTTFTPPLLSPQERTLLDAVLANPDGDEPRLRFAEWYEKDGDPRGQFIRVQILSSRSHAEPGKQDEGEAASLALLAPWSPRDVVFRRGFVEALSLSGRAFISIGAELFRLIPLRAVRLVAVQPFVGELALAPHLIQLDGLDLSGNCIGDVGLKALAASPHLGRLRFLDFSRNNLGDESAAELCRLSLPRLEKLSLRENRFTSIGEETLRKTFGSLVLL